MPSPPPEKDPEQGKNKTTTPHQFKKGHTFTKHGSKNTSVANGSQKHWAIARTMDR